MAKHPIFIGGTTNEEEVTEGYTYSYQEENGKGILRVYNQNVLIYESEAEIGEGFHLVVTKKTEYVEPINLPEEREKLIAFLLGFDEKERASTDKEYEELSEERRSICSVHGYVEKINAGPNFEFAKYSVISEEGYAYHALACWIDAEISDNEILHLIPEFVFPVAFIKKVLHEKLGINIEGINKVLSFLGVR